MMERMRRAAPWLLLAACAAAMGLAGALPRLRPKAREEAAAPPPRGVMRAVGEEAPLRAFLPREPVFWEELGAWRVHPALDRAAETARAERAGRVSRVWRDRLWGICVELDCAGERWVYRSLAGTDVREGDLLAAGDALGAAGACPAEAELGPHVHIERFRGDAPLDPLGE